MGDDIILQKNYRILGSPILIEGAAIQQLDASSKLRGIETAVGLPDLHPGKGIPIGAVFATANIIYPHLIGNDIGCGMSLFQTDVPQRKIKLSKLESRLEGLETPMTAADSHCVTDRLDFETAFDQSLGTIGGGNHFAELQAVEEVLDIDSFQEHKLTRENAFLLVHSGSRGLGDSILQSHVRTFGAEGLEIGGTKANEYLAQHEQALTWASVNRELIALRFAHFLGAELNNVLDLPHNFLSLDKIREKQLWIHRKGATSSLHELLIIPGSRGTLSYLVKPIGVQDENLFSISHGAGRKWQRSECKAQLSQRIEKSSLLRTKLGGRVICENTDLLYEEAPQAYKKIETVIKNLTDLGLIKTVATLRPVLTYKTRRRV